MFGLDLNLDVLDEGKLVKIDENTIYDTIVIGSGPAAVSAAVYAVRKGLKTAMIGVKIGGQVLDTNDIENIIGTPKTTGSSFASQLEKHMKEYEIAFKSGHMVKNVKLEGDLKVVLTDDEKEYKTKTVIVATGAKHRHLNVPGEEDYAGKGVHFCTTCDGPFYKGLNVAVVGGGNSGVEAALDMSGIATNVTLVEFMPELKADQLLQDKLKEKENVRIITNTYTKEIQGGEFTEKMIVVNRDTEQEEELSVDGIFVEIGLSANSDVVKDLVETNKIGEIVINPENNETSVKGIFAAGDVTTIKQKQIIISMGEGAKAALSAFEYVIKN